MPTLTPLPTYEKRPVWEIVVNTAGAALEMLWPGNWFGAPIVQDISKEPTGKGVATGLSGYPWLKSAQLAPALTPDDVKDPVDFLPLMIGTVTAVFFIVRK